jgi:hypothetical protein
MKQYIHNHAREPSNWRGPILFLATKGFSIALAMAEHFLTVGLGIAGLIRVATKG